MNHKSKTVLRWAAALAVTAISTGCVQQPKPLYHWGAYQDQVYAYFKNADAGYEAQIIALEADTQKARSAGAEVPPGFHAHLGMLYAQIGKEDQVRQQFETEKTLFPESATFMDFLASKYADQGARK
ncbi:DUF4810 domain-containing protein [Agrobacterium tumefaciens]|uniref:DUF4810 domain-containing protein n=1 Tax=Agrobacterium tumefaciens TaxID=358 RepID=UPI003B9E22F7